MSGHQHGDGRDGDVEMSEGRSQSPELTAADFSEDDWVALENQSVLNTMETWDRSPGG